MSARAGEDISRVARFYTKSRKYPKMIGRAGGSKLWGGPYTYSQLFGGLFAAWVAWMLLDAREANLIAKLFGTAVVFGVVVFALRFVPVTNLNPLLLVNAAARAFVTPQAGKFKGTKFRFRQARRAPVQTRPLAQPPRLRSRAQSALEALPVTPQQVALRSELPLAVTLAPQVELGTPAPAPAPPRALSGVERLLAQTSSH